MALSLDGVDDQVDHGDIAALDALGALSISFWLQVVTPTVNAGPLSKCTLGSGSDGFNLQFRDSGTSIAFGTNGNANYGGTAASTVTEDVWEHWGIVFDGSGAANADRLKIYKNGSSALSLTFAGTIPASYVDSSEPLRVGRSRELTFAPLYLAHLKIWAAALTLAEVQSEIYTQRPHRTADLKLWSPYDDGTSARDYSGNANHGTVTGTTQISGPPVSYGASLLIGH